MEKKLKKIGDVIAGYTGIGYPEMTDAIRTRHYVISRQIMACLLDKYAKITHEQIGKILGGLDHSTITHSISQVETYKVTNENPLTHKRDFNAIFSDLDIKSRAVIFNDHVTLKKPGNQMVFPAEGHIMEAADQTFSGDTSKNLEKFMYKASSDNDRYKYGFQLGARWAVETIKYLNDYEDFDNIF